MIITENFVFLHHAKTGGTFITEVLRKLNRNLSRQKNLGKQTLIELMNPNTIRVNSRNRLTVHGTYEQIPEEYRERSILSCIRNPFDRYVSLYEYRQWQRKAFTNQKIISDKFPEFPNLSFERYIEFVNMIDLPQRPHYDKLSVDIGLQSYGFIQMFAKNVLKTIQSLDEEYIENGNFVIDMPTIHFLRMENLNQELYEALLGFGYPQDLLDFILHEKRIYPGKKTRKETQTWTKYYDKALYERIRYHERFLLKIFKEYDRAWEELQG